MNMSTDDKYFFIDCSICQSIFTKWSFRRLVQDHDNVDFQWKKEYLKDQCMNTAVLTSLITMTNHKYHNCKICVWHTVIDLTSVQVQVHPDTTSFIYEIEEEQLVIICRNGMHFFTAVFQKSHDSEFKKGTQFNWEILIYDSIETSISQKKLELQVIFYKFNIHPGRVQLKIAQSKKQNDTSSCGFYAYFYLYMVVCNKSEAQLFSESCNKICKDTDSAMRSFCIQKYDSMFSSFRSLLLKFGPTSLRKKNFGKYHCLVAQSVDGKIVKYNERKSNQLWDYLTTKEGPLESQLPISSTNVFKMSLFEVLQLIKENDTTVDTIPLDILSMKKVDETKYRFNVTVIKDLSEDLGEDTYLLTLSKQLLLKWFEPQDRQKLHGMFSKLQNIKNRYMMVSLFGETCQGWRNKHPGLTGELKCIGTLIGIHSTMGLYISHIAVSEESYSKGVFGNSSDQRTFRKRGIAGILLCVAQSFSKMRHNNCPNIYAWSYNENRKTENKHCCWTQMGFKDADYSNTKEWPIEMSYIIEHFTLYCDESCQEFERLTPVIIKSNLKYSFCKHLYQGQIALTNRDELIYEWPTNTSEQSSCGSVVKYLQNSVSEVVVNIPHHLKSLYGVLDSQRKLLLNYSTELDFIPDNAKPPKVAVDYFSHLFMLQFHNVFILSSEFCNQCLENGTISQCSFSHPDMLLLSEQAQNKDATFLFPFIKDTDWNDGNWNFVITKWIDSELFFLFCCSSSANSTKYIAHNAKKVPKCIITMFMNSHLWPMNEYANWINVPFVKFDVTHNNSIIIPCMYMLIVSKSPHKVLLLFHELHEHNKKKIEGLCTGWISFMLHFKCWFVPDWMKRLLKKETSHNYSISWCTKKTNRILLLDNTYQEYLSELHHKALPPTFQSLAIETTLNEQLPLMENLTMNQNMKGLQEKKNCNIVENERETSFDETFVNLFFSLPMDERNLLIYDGKSAESQNIFKKFLQKANVSSELSIAQSQDKSVLERDHQEDVFDYLKDNTSESADAGVDSKKMCEGDNQEVFKDYVQFASTECDSEVNNEKKLGIYKEQQMTKFLHIDLSKSAIEEPYETSNESSNQLEDMANVVQAMKMLKNTLYDIPIPMFEAAAINDDFTETSTENTVFAKTQSQTLIHTEHAICTTEISNAGIKEQLFSVQVPIGVQLLKEVQWSNIKKKQTNQYICQCLPSDDNIIGNCLDNSCTLFASQEECGMNCPNRASCSNRRIQNEEWKKVQVFDTGSEKGLGLRTLETILKGEPVIEYIGQATCKTKLDNLKKKYKKKGLSYVLHLEENIYIDATEKGGVARYMNHSCQPNCSLEKWRVNGVTRAVFFAKEKIGYAEELTFDYAWSSTKEATNYKCICGSFNCRGTIELKTANEAENKTTKEQHRLHFTTTDSDLLGGHVINHGEGKLHEEQSAAKLNKKQKHHNRKSKMVPEIFHTIKDLLLLFNEVSTINPAPKRNSNIIFQADCSPPKCTICGWGVANDYSCRNCKQPLHFKCGFRARENGDLYALCGTCFKGRKRLLFEIMKDSELSSKWLPCNKKERVAVNAVKVQKEKEQKLHEFYDGFFTWLSTVDEIQCKEKADTHVFFGRNKEMNRVRKIDSLLLKDTLFEFFPSLWKNFMQGKKGQWYSLPNDLKFFIRSHGRCLATDHIYRTIEKCYNNNWTYIKFNCKTKTPTSICDCSSDFESDNNAAHISFTNNIQMGAEVQFVPLYFLRIWLYVCEQGRTLYHQPANELLDVINQAKNSSNTWIQIPEGATKRNKKMTDMSLDGMNKGPVSFRVQPHWEHSCVFNSLMNAFHYINDYHARDEVYKNLEVSLNYTRMSSTSHSRSSFAAYIVNQRITGYKIIKLSNLDILGDRSVWPTLCVLEPTSGIITHAITTVENFIFDSNLSGAIELTKTNLDWCCSDDFDPVQFKKVKLAYRFIKVKPRCNMLLRTEKQRLSGLNSIIQSFYFFQDSKIASALDKLRCQLKKEECIITQIREFVKKKEFGYRPVLLKSTEDVLSTSCQFPSIFLIGHSSTFHYEVLSTVKNVLHDGKSSQPIRLCTENLIHAVDPSSVRFANNDGIEFIFGYTFMKDQKKCKINI